MHNCAVKHHHDPGAVVNHGPFHRKPITVHENLAACTPRKDAAKHRVSRQIKIRAQQHDAIMPKFGHAHTEPTQGAAPLCRAFLIEIVAAFMCKFVAVPRSMVTYRAHCRSAFHLDAGRCPARSLTACTSDQLIGRIVRQHLQVLNCVLNRCCSCHARPR